MFERTEIFSIISLYNTLYNTVCVCVCERERERERERENQTEAWERQKILKESNIIPGTNE